MIAFLLDSFDAREEPPMPAPPAAPEVDGAGEAERLAAYESGYRSGWDDCVAAERQATERIGAELARNLADLGFTYHEARTQMLAEAETFLGALFRAVLPRVAGTAVARMMVDDLLEMASGALELPVEIVVTPADAPVVARLVGEATTMPVKLVEEPALAEGQAYLRFGRAEHAYDLSDLAGRLCDALASRGAGPTLEMRDAG